MKTPAQIEPVDQRDRFDARHVEAAACARSRRCQGAGRSSTHAPSCQRRCPSTSTCARPSNDTPAGAEQVFWRMLLPTCVEKRCALRRAPIAMIRVLSPSLCTRGTSARHGARAPDLPRRLDLTALQPYSLTALLRVSLALAGSGKRRGRGGHLLYTPHSYVPSAQPSLHTGHWFALTASGISTRHRSKHAQWYVCLHGSAQIFSPTWKCFIRQNHSQQMSQVFSTSLSEAVMMHCAGSLLCQAEAAGGATRSSA